MEYGIWNFHGGLWPANTIAALNGATLTPVTALPTNGGGGAVSFAIAASTAALLNSTTDDIDNNIVGQSDTSIDQNTTESTSSEPANNESQTQTDSVFASDLSNACDDNAVDNHNMKIENQIGLLAQQFHPVYNLIFGQLNGQQTEQNSDSDESSDNNETNETSSNQFKLKSTKVSSCEIIPLYGEQPTTSREGSSDSKTTCNDTDAEPTLHQCPVSGCEFRATFREELDRHVLAHEDKALKNRRGLSMQRIRYEREEYHCSLCPYTCTTERAYLRHLRLHSLGAAPQNRLSCAVCGRDRSSEASMAKHMRKHRDDRYFCCDLCAFRTVQLKKLIQHRRMHTGEKPHLCPHCAYRSARRDNLRSHVRRVHKRPNLICDTFSPRGMLLTPSVKPSTSSREIAVDENEDDADV